MPAYASENIIYIYGGRMISIEHECIIIHTHTHTLSPDEWT